MADSAMSFGKHWSYYRELGRPFRPEVVCIFLQSSGVEMMEADPEAFARFYEYEPGHFPCSLFREAGDGGLIAIEPDPEYFRFVGKDPARRAARDAEKKRGGYYSDGVDWNTVYFRTDWESVPAPARKAVGPLRPRPALLPRRAGEGRGPAGDRPDPGGPALGRRVEQGLHGRGRPAVQQPARRRAGRQAVQGPGGRLPERDAGRGGGACPTRPIYTWRHDGHPCAYGNRVLAESVCEYLLRTNFARLGVAPPSPAVDRWVRGGR